MIQNIIHVGALVLSCMQSNALSWVVAWEPTNEVSHIWPFDGLSCLFGFELMTSAQMRSNGSKREFVHREVFEFVENVRADGSMAHLTTAFC